MRAVVVEDGSLRLEPRQAVPILKEDDVLIRVQRAAVSRFDANLVTHTQGFAGIPGHEFVGLVEDASSAAGKSIIGQRVVASPSTFCGKCNMCQAGLSALCRERRTIGLGGLPGCLAEYLALPARNVVPIPDELDNDHAVFAHLVASAIQASRQITIEGRPFITVLGDGPLGMVTAQVMAKLNASVRVIGRYSEKLSLCEKWGIKHRHMDDIGRRADQDIVVDCTGSPDGFLFACELVRPRGTIVVKSLAMRPGQLPGSALGPIVQNEVRIVGSQFGPMREAVLALVRGEIQPLSLITRRAPLADAVDALRLAARPGTLKVIVEC